MACLEDLQQDVSDILAFLQSSPPCCDGIDITDGDQYTDRVEDGVGDVPQNIIDAGYASGASDWAGFDDYKCMICHVTVDQLSARLNELAPYVDSAGVIFGGFATVAVIITTIFTGGLTAMAWGIIASTGIVAFLYSVISDGSLLETLADKVDTNHEELVCAMYNSDGDDSALSELNDKIDELFTAPEALILKNLNLSPTVKSLYSGRYDQQDIADILLDAGYELGDFTCDCDQVGEFLYYTDFETGTLEEWDDHGNPTVPFGGGENSDYGAYLSFADTDDIYHSLNTLLGGVGESGGAGDKIQIHRVKFSYQMTGAAGQVRLRCRNDAGDEDNVYGYSATWAQVEEIFSPPLESTYNVSPVVELKAVNWSINHLRLDNIYVDFDYEPA